jgi:hypothetical protein
MSDEPTANVGEIVRRAVLHAIARSGRINPAAIQLECQGADERDVAAAVRRLVADGLVERAPGARGYVGVLHDLRLTGEGRHAVGDGVTPLGG